MRGRHCAPAALLGTKYADCPRKKTQPKQLLAPASSPRTLLLLLTLTNLEHVWLPPDVQEAAAEAAAEATAAVGAAATRGATSQREQTSAGRPTQQEAPFPAAGLQQQQPAPPAAALRSALTPAKRGLDALVMDDDEDLL